MTKVVELQSIGLVGEISPGEDGVERLTVHTARFAVPTRVWDTEGGVWAVDNPKMGNVVIDGVMVYTRENR